MFERFTDRARKVMALANQEAHRLNHEYIGSEHIILGLVSEGSGTGATVLKNLNVDVKKLRLEVEKQVPPNGPDMVTMGKLPQTPRVKNVIKYAIEESGALNHNYVGTEHILLGLLRESEGTAAQVFMNLGLKLEDVRQEVLNLLGAGVEREKPRQKITNDKEVDAENQHMKNFLVDLTRPEKLLVVLYYYEELTMPEIAKVLELSESQVSQMHSSIIERIRSYMQGRS